MDFYKQGALSAQRLFKVADLFASPIGRKIFSNTIRAVLDPEGKPRIVRSLEPYYDEYIEGDPEAFNRFDDRLHARMGQ
jgi:hypothetical protein